MRANISKKKKQAIVAVVTAVYFLALIVASTLGGHDSSMGAAPSVGTGAVNATTGHDDRGNQTQNATLPAIASNMLGPDR